MWVIVTYKKMMVTVCLFCMPLCKDETNIHWRYMHGLQQEPCIASYLPSVVAGGGGEDHLSSGNNYADWLEYRLMNRLNLAN